MGRREESGQQPGDPAAARPAPARRWRPRLTRPRRSTGVLARRRARTGMLLTAPAFALVAVFFLLPLGLVVYMSVHNWPLFGQTRFIGLANYREMLHDGTFGHSLLFTAKYTAIVTPVQIVLGYLLAVMVRRKLRGVGFFRTVYFMPVVVGFAASAYAVLVMITPGIGVVDTILKALGLDNGQTNWVTSPGLALLVVIVLITWKTVGIAMILFMAGMQAVPEELYEAAKVDGAGWWAREFHVTLPLIRRTMALVLVLTVAGSVLAFDQFFILTQGGPDNATLTAVLWIYTTAFLQYRFGYAAALSIVLLILLVILSAVQIRALRGGGETD